MLVVRVEIWPDGHADQAREIGRAGFVNVSALADLSDYVVVRNDNTGAVAAHLVPQHHRAAGFWPLLARGFGKEAEPLPDRWHPLAMLALDRLERCPGPDGTADAAGVRP